MFNLSLNNFDITLNDHKNGSVGANLGVKFVAPKSLVTDFNIPR